MTFMTYVIETRNDLQGRAAILIASKARIQQALIELRRFKHHLTGAKLQDSARVSRENEIVDAEKELVNVELELELVQTQIKALTKPR